MNATLHQGKLPLLISMPHIGTQIPEHLRAGFTERALGVEDTDWHLDRLYDFAPELGASVIQPVMSRYVIDLNRPSDNTPMYPGAANTELCPTRFFTSDPLYRDGFAPAGSEVERRRRTYWQPYHDVLQSELDRLRARHGFALLWDAHSIRTEIPWLFAGKLPDLNIGTANGLAAHVSITNAVMQVCGAQSQFSHVANGRFKGGHITRHYGKPTEHIHAVQLEKCQRLYMNETAPFDYLDDRAAQLKPLLKSMIGAALAAATALHSHEK